MTQTGDLGQSEAHWDELTTQQFIELSMYVVPEREYQIETICDLIPAREGSCNIMELCCGEGLLAEAILERFARCTVFGYDGSAGMLAKARSRLARFGVRFQPMAFELHDTTWRRPNIPFHAVVSSLAIHHLDGPQKLKLYTDIYELLDDEGVLVVADVMRCAHPLGEAVAGQAWDQAVQKRSLEHNGHLGAFHFFERERWNSYKYSDPDDIDHPSTLFDQLIWLEKSGFVDIDVYWMLAGHALFGGRKSTHTRENVGR